MKMLTCSTGQIFWHGGLVPVHVLSYGWVLPLQCVSATRSASSFVQCAWQCQMARFSLFLDWNWPGPECGNAPARIVGSRCCVADCRPSGPGCWSTHQTCPWRPSTSCSRRCSATPTSGQAPATCCSTHGSSCTVQNSTVVRVWALEPGEMEPTLLCLAFSCSWSRAQVSAQQQH